MRADESVQIALTFAHKLVGKYFNEFHVSIRGVSAIGMFRWICALQHRFKCNQLHRKAKFGNIRIILAADYILILIITTLG